MSLNALGWKLPKFNSIYLIQPLFNACFYGIKSVFVLYAIQRFSLSESEAFSLYATYMTLSYGTTLIGGYLADKGLGVKNAVMLGGALTGVGLLCTLFPSLDVCYAGLTLASMGAGLFKPNLLTAVGLIFEDPKDAEKDKAYSIIYMAGNVGIFTLTILCSFIGKVYGWHYGIVFVAVFFMGATWLAWKKMQFHPSYKGQITALSPGKAGVAILTLLVMIYFLLQYRESFHSMMRIIAAGSVVYLGKIIYQCSTEERKGVLSVMGYILPFALFVACFEQSGSSLTLFLSKAVDREVMGIILPAPTILSLGPLFVLICGSILLYACRYLERTKPLAGLNKMGCGFLFAASSFWILALGAYQNEGASIPLLWFAGAIFIQTFGELWVAPISMSKISQSAPPRLQGVMMSFWTMAIAYGQYFAGIIAQFSIGGATTLEDSLEQYRIFFFYLGIAPLCIGLFLLLCQRLKPSGKKT